MYRDDSNRERIASLMDMLKMVSIDMDPVRSISHYARAMRQLYGEQGLISVSLRNAPPGHYRVMRFLNQRGAGLDNAQDIEFAGPDAPAVSGGIIGEILRNEDPVVYRNLHVVDDPVLGTRLAPYRVLVAIPVYDGSRVLNWVCFMMVNPEGLTAYDIEMRILQANLLSGIANIKRANLELVQATEWIHREVDEIALIQQGLLPGAMPHIPGLKIATSHQSFDRAGGDLYDVFPLGRCPETELDKPGLWGILIADVSGHGVAAAVITAMISTLIDALAERVVAPGQLLTLLNRYVTAKAINGNFVTAFLLVYDSVSEVVTYASAGHNLPLLRDANGEVRALPQTEGIPLGIASTSTYETVPFALEPGQSLLLYTDGITESQSPQGDLFGEAALVDVLRLSNGNPAETIDAVMRALETHQQGQSQTDDQALVAIALSDDAR
jgi:sigma-B regulation protein RsbU (phosphoserine phosphatase)